MTRKPINIAELLDLEQECEELKMHLAEAGVREVSLKRNAINLRADVERLRKKVSRLEKKNEALKEKAWMYDDLCK